MREFANGPRESTLRVTARKIEKVFLKSVRHVGSNWKTLAHTNLLPLPLLNCTPLFRPLFTIYCPKTLSSSVFISASLFANLINLIEKNRPKHVSCDLREVTQTHREFESCCHHSLWERNRRQKPRLPLLSWRTNCVCVSQICTKCHYMCYCTI